MNSLIKHESLAQGAAATPPHILMVDPSLFTPSYDAALIHALRAQGASVELVGRPPRRSEAPSEPAAVPHFYRWFDTAPHLLGLPGAALKAMEHALDGLRFASSAGSADRLLHFQWLPFPLADAALLRVARRRGPVVATVHDTAPFNGTPTASLQVHGFAAALDGAHRLIVHTESGRRRLRKLGIDEERIRVIPHGPLPGAPTARPHVRDPRWTVVAFGKLRPYKGLDVLVEAAAALDAETRAGLRIIIAGEPAMDLRPLRAAIAANCLEGVVEIRDRWHDDEALATLFSEADAFVFPHREVEASGVFFLVQGLGRWLIASRIGAFAEAIEDGVSGRLVPPEAADALAEALADGVSRRPGPAAPPRVADWDSIARATLATYAEALDQWSACSGEKAARR